MKLHLSLVLLLAFAPAVLRAESCCEACTAPIKPADATAEASAMLATETPAPVGHPLRGVVVEILADQQALLVEHEEIPGVMKAMTMVLKVDAAVLATVKKDQPITATLLKKSDGWWLLDVKPVLSEK